MNNLKSYTEYAVSTPTTDFVIGFDFNYGTDAVNVTVDNVPATEAGYSVIYLNSTTMRLNPAVPSGVVRLQRETDIDVPDNQFTAGAKFIASNMDENFTQIRHSQQEVRDGFEKLSEDTYEIIDTLQDVGQAAQDAADAAEQAAITANDAAAQVNDKVSQSQLDYIHENGAALPYAAGITYEENAVVVKDGVLQQWKGGVWVDFLDDFANKDEVKRGIANRYDPLLTYNSGERVILTNGDIVKSTVDGNTNDPNVDMTGWVYDDYIYKNYHLVSKWGAKGDGVTQDRLAIQAAIDDLHAIYMSTGIVQTLIYEDNKKYVCNQIAIKEGVNHVSIGQSTLLKTPATPDDTQAGLYWRNIFYPEVNANSLLKDRILIENLVFDGNYNNMNWTSGSYEQQQGGSLYMHSADIPLGKRLKYELRNVVLKDSVGDGLLVSRNSDVIVRGLKTEDCFRGGVTIVGGNSIIDIDGMIGENANLHIELDGGGNDTDTPYKIIGSFKNISIDKDRGLNAPWGGFYYTNSAGSSVNFENVKVYSRDFHIEGTTIGSDLTRNFTSSADFHNCHFIVSGTSRVFFPRGMNFHNCTFKYKMLDDATADNNGMLWYWRTSSGSAPIGQISNFYDCKFIGDTVNGFKFRSAFAVDSTPNSAFGFLNTYRCTFSGFRHGTYAPYGFRGEHHDCIYDSEIGILVGSTTLVGGGSLKFKLKNPTFTKNCTLALSILEALNDGTTELEFVDVSIDRSKLNQANLPTINGTLKGFLEVISDVAPNPLSTSVDTLWGGTRWKVLANTAIPVYEYVNTAANGVKNKDTWLASVFITKTGNTASRPTLTKFDVGVTYFNTETNKVEFWNGSAWV